MENVYNSTYLGALTNYCEVDLGISCLRNLEVHPTAVNTGVLLSNVVNAKLCGLPVWHKVGAVREHILVGPPLGRSELVLACVHTGTHGFTSRLVPAGKPKQGNK
jgi:hypothetical protein